MRVPQGLLPSANYFQQTMTEVVLPGLIYNTCVDHIVDLLVVGSSEIEYLANLRQLFERLRSKNLTLNPAKVKLGASLVQFVGHKIDPTGLNMSKNESKTQLI